MKKLWVIILLLSAGYGYAQETDTRIEPLPSLKEHRQELSLMVQFGNDMRSPENMAIMGLQYKRFKNAQLGYRVFAAYCNLFYEEDYTKVSMVPDTFRETRDRQNVHMAMLGWGLEAQRHFYKQYTLFAAMELKMGYGNGQMDTLSGKTYPLSPGYAYEQRMSKANDVNMFYMAFTPTVGIKAQRKRLTAAIELLPIIFSIRNTVYDKKYNLFAANLSMFDFSTRLSVGYRF